MPVKNREHQLRLQRAHYRANKSTYYKRSSERARKLVEWVGEYKTRRGCELCSERHPWTLEFHHPNPDIKDGSIANLRQRMNGVALLIEMEKCHVLCANCHRKEHYQLTHSLPSLLSEKRDWTYSEEDILIRLRELDYPFSINRNRNRRRLPIGQGARI